MDLSFPATGTFGLRITPKGKKRFFLRYRINGRARRIFLGDYPALSLAQARKEALDKVNEVCRDMDPVEEKKKRLGETFEWLGNEYLERYAREKKKKKSAAEDERILKTYLNPAWGHLPFVSIKRGDVVALVDQIGTKQRHPIMANRVLALVSKIYNFAIEKAIVSEEFVNPARLVKPFPEQSRERVLSNDEIKSSGKPWRIENTKPAPSTN